MVGYLTETLVLKADPKGTDNGIVNREGHTRDVGPWNSSKPYQAASMSRADDGGTVYRGLCLRSGQRGTSNGTANRSSGFGLVEKPVMLD